MLEIVAARLALLQSLVPYKVLCVQRVAFPKDFVVVPLEAQRANRSGWQASVVVCVVVFPQCQIIRYQVRTGPLDRSHGLYSWVSYFSQALLRQGRTPRQRRTLPSSAVRFRAERSFRTNFRLCAYGPKSVVICIIARTCPSERTTHHHHLYLKTWRPCHCSTQLIADIYPIEPCSCSVEPPSRPLSGI
jgi:hypothetical protein